MKPSQQWPLISFKLLCAEPVSSLRVGVTSAASWTADTPGTGAETCRNCAQLRPLCPKSFWEKEKRLVFSRRTAVLFHMDAYGDLLSTLCQKHDETWPRSRHKHRKRTPRVVQRLNRVLPGNALNISSVSCYFMLLLFLHLMIALEQLLGFTYNIFLFLILGHIVKHTIQYVVSMYAIWRYI